VTLMLNGSLSAAKLDGLRGYPHFSWDLNGRFPNVAAANSVSCKWARSPAVLWVGDVSSNVSSFTNGNICVFPMP
jgi:hypothetical protein